MSLSLDAWHGDDRDGSEPQREREARQAAAVEVCLNCPVMVQCDAYASSVVVEDGQARLAEPAGIWGGRLALERHRAFIKRRHEVASAAPVRKVRTPQRLRVLEALAVHADAEAVAEAAGVDVRTANWQRSRLVTQLNLDKESATRRELLAAAVERGLLDAGVVVGDDGRVPAVPPPPSRPTQATQLALWGGTPPRTPRASGPPRSRRARRGSVSRRVVLVPSGAPVLPLFPTNEPMEAAA
ncbi:WhiB family transcriptional regulator [Streptomyces ardesiacus]|uniref:WhiB family transcriptional regulator n=1 Tax=Streptomyces ardesiacus TaxID=285564 RepID=UPI003F4A5AD5